MKKLLLIVAALMLPVFAMCGETTGKITSVIVNPSLGNTAAIKISGNATGENGCEITQDWNYAIDLASEAGKAQLSLALMAHASDMTVVASEEVTKHCSLIGGVWNLGFIYTVK